MNRQSIRRQFQQRPTNPRGRLPSYAAEMAYFHKAFAAELRELIDRLPLRRNMRIVDVGCGDGFYAGLFAERLDSLASVVGLDVNSAFISQARRLTENLRTRCDVAFVEGKLDQHPLDESQFDLAWCAQCLYSLREPTDAIRQLIQLVRPGGTVAVLENDTLHQLLLPWPMPLEIAIRAAEYRALRRASIHPDKYYIGRRLVELLAEAGLEPVGFHIQSIVRTCPLESAVELFLREHLRRLAERVSPWLIGRTALQFAELTNPASSRCILRRPHLTFVWQNVLAWGARPLTAEATG